MFYWIYTFFKMIKIAAINFKFFVLNMENFDQITVNQLK